MMQITAPEPIRCEAATQRGTRCKRPGAVWRIARGTVLACCTQHDRMGYPVPWWDVQGRPYSERPTPTVTRR